MAIASLSLFSFHIVTQPKVLSTDTLMPENANGALAKLNEVITPPNHRKLMKQLHNFLISITNTPLKSHSLDFRYQS
jgi:hypothetical protein